MTAATTESQRPKVVYLDWSQPPLIAAARWLWEQHSATGQGRHSSAVPWLVLPTSWACHRINELCQDLARAAQRPFVPFEAVTVGELPERLYDQKKASATPLIQNLAWVAALRRLPESSLKRVFPELELNNLATVTAVADRLHDLHERLGADIWSFRSVARELPQLAPELPSDPRWEVLAELQQLYYELLNAEDLWDRQAARNVAIRQHLCRTRRPIVLIGLADLNRGPREMLRQCGNLVTSLVFCAPEDREGFDELGCLVTEYWDARRVSVPDSAIRFVDRPTDQARVVAEFLEDFSDPTAVEQSVVGAPDENVWPHLERMARQRGWQAVRRSGERVKDGSVVRLLQLLAHYLDNQSYGSFAEIIRHPDLYAWLSQRLGRLDWLSDIDDFQNEMLPAEISLDSSVPETPNTTSGRSSGSQKKTQGAVELDPRLNPVVENLRQLLDAVRPQVRSLAEWGRGWLKVLLEVYGDSKSLLPTEELDLLTIESIRALADLFAESTAAAPGGVTVESAVDSLSVLLRYFDHRIVDRPANVIQLDLLGWLEIPWDDRPALIVTGMNNHVVPACEVSHMFLPNNICARLGLLDNRRRWARDVYLMNLIQASRPHVMWVVGRRDSQKNPLQISRLLLHADDDTLVRRAQAFFGFDEWQRVVARGESAGTALNGMPPINGMAPPTGTRMPAESSDRGLSGRPLRQAFLIPKPPPSGLRKPLSITRFRDYLKCPYRFYLQVILGLAEASDSLREFSGGQFGDLAHNVLEQFGQHAIRDSDDPLAIRDYLLKELKRQTSAAHSRSQLPSLKLQIENLELRLERFAELQAEHRRAGWEILETERMYEHSFVVDGVPFLVKGKIDRVDVHREQHRLTIWDYKTSDSGKSADEAHRQANEWIDLQLPLYRHLVTQVHTQFDLSEVAMGYVLLPNNTSKIQFDLGGWTPEELQAADETAFKVMRLIREGVFWPPAEEPPDFSDPTARICQDHVFDRWEICD